jgi:hypothetical protein
MLEDRILVHGRVGLESLSLLLGRSSLQFYRACVNSSRVNTSIGACDCFAASPVPYHSIGEERKTDSKAPNSEDNSKRDMESSERTNERRGGTNWNEGMLGRGKVINQWGQCQARTCHRANHALQFYGENRGVLTGEELRPGTAPLLL